MPFGRHLLAICCLLPGAAALAAPAFISVPDLVREARIGDPGSVLWNDSGLKGTHNAAVISPDGKKAAIVVRWGDPKHKRTVGDLYLYSLAPNGKRTLVRVARKFSQLNSQPLAMVRWLDDSKTILFVGADGYRSSQVFSIDTANGHLNQLTHVKNLMDYRVSSDGRRLLAVDFWPIPQLSDDPVCQKEGCRVKSEGLWQSEHSDFGTPPMTVFAAGRAGVHHVVNPESAFPSVETCLYLTLSEIPRAGRFAVMTCRLQEKAIPEAWNDYADLQSLLAQRGVAGQSLYSAEHSWQMGQLFKIDLGNGHISPVVNTPYSDYFGKTVWIEGGKRLVVVGGFMPQHGRDDTSRAWSIFAIDPVTGTVDPIAPLDPSSRVVAASWDEGSGILSIQTARTQGASTTKSFYSYQRKGGAWAVAAMPPSQETDRFKLADGTELKAVEGLTAAPKLVAVSATGETTVLLEPNAWLSERVLGQTKMVSWPLKDGRIWNGILIYPPDYDSAKRYPLVLQTHGIVPAAFSLAGVSRNYPGQALASRGFFVLQVADMAMGVAHHEQGAKEYTTIQSAYEGAIDELDKQGLIDRSRVGITGWSRSGPYAAYTMTHSNYDFAAASFMSTGGLGYWYYLGNSRDLQEGEEQDFDGAMPFNTEMKTWLDMAPDLSMGRVRTPTMMWADFDTFPQWDWYASLHRQGIPAEFWFLPTGAHELLDVEHRLTTIQRMVDWFCYWLKDEEDPDPAKKDQYDRWRSMRAEFEKVKANPRPPLLQWDSTPIAPSH